jgi:hypothetical protein
MDLKDFTASALPRLIAVHSIDSADALQHALTSWMDKVSTIGLSKHLSEEQWLSGVDTSTVRVCALGTMQTPPFGRLHDGLPMWPRLQ